MDDDIIQTSEPDLAYRQRLRAMLRSQSIIWDPLELSPLDVAAASELDELGKKVGLPRLTYYTAKKLPKEEELPDMPKKYRYD
jgi:hypothetical protein